MSPKVLGPLAGVVASAFLSMTGVLISWAMGGNVASSITLLHTSAIVVLLVAFHVRMEAQAKKSESRE